MIICELNINDGTANVRLRLLESCPSRQHRYEADGDFQGLGQTGNRQNDHENGPEHPDQVPGTPSSVEEIRVAAAFINAIKAALLDDSNMHEQDIE